MFEKQKGRMIIKSVRRTTSDVALQKDNNKTKVKWIHNDIQEVFGVLIEGCCQWWFP